MHSQSAKLLEIRDLVVEINVKDSGPVYPVRGLSFSVDKGEITALVGESGCGKSVTAFSIMRLLKHGLFRKLHGTILFKGMDISTCSEKEMRKIRGMEMAMIFQEPMTALNPVFTTGSQIAEAITTHLDTSGYATKKRVHELLTMVGVPHAEQVAMSWPHQLSGGLRQRAMIAMALACNPDLIIADEPTTALDVSIQSRILDMMKEMQVKNNLGMLLITHNLGVVASIADHVLVMYAGRIVESAPVMELFKSPLHPYTIGLMNAVPYGHGQTMKRLSAIRGSVPSLDHIPNGCAFSNRCDMVNDECIRNEPELLPAGKERLVSCHFVHKKHLNIKQKENS